jgi:uncharacterized repeat protein (TIGR03943 family)
MRWSPTRVATGVALAAWAAVFWFLMISGRTSLYLSSRTDWVIPVGAIILTLTAAGRLLSARTDQPEPLARRDAWALGLVALPVVAILALPPASLGSYAASRRSAGGAGIVSSSADVSSGAITLSDVAASMWSDETMNSLTGRAGADVSFVGFVTRREGMPADEFMLTRFLVSCCVADALSVQVRVVGAPPGRFESDQWVKVQGAIYPLGREVVVDAARAVPVPRPDHPYLNV